MVVDSFLGRGLGAGVDVGAAAPGIVLRLGRLRRV